MNDTQSVQDSGVRAMNDNQGHAVTLKTMIHTREDGEECVCAECRALRAAITSLKADPDEELITELYAALADKPIELSHRMAAAIRRNQAS